jgi:hypothetical protein
MTPLRHSIPFMMLLVTGSLLMACGGDGEAIVGTASTAILPRVGRSATTTPSQEPATLAPEPTKSSVCSTPLSVQLKSPPAKILQFIQKVVGSYKSDIDPASLKTDPAYASDHLFFDVLEPNHDSQPDLVVSAVIPPDDPLGPGGYYGSFIVSGCGGQGVELVPLAGSDSGYQCEGDSCSLQTTIRDFLGTGQPQVLVLATYHFMNQGGSRITLTGWYQGKWERLMDEMPDIGPVRSVASYDSDHDGIQEISVWGYESGTTALEAARPSYSTYDWSPSDRLYELFETKRMPPVYKYQVLDDAQRALDSGNLQYAIALYLSAIDQPYQDVPSFWELNQAVANSMSEDSLLAEAEAYQTSFATFRLAYLYLFIDQPSDADTSLRALEQEISPDQPGHEFAEISTQMLDQVVQGRALLGACQDAVRAAVLKYPHLLGPEGHIGDWGNTSTLYTESNLCPDLDR